MMEELIKAAHPELVMPAGFERRVLLAAACQEAARLHRRANWTLIAAAACFAGLILSFPLASIVSSVSRLIENL